jgi:putative ATP-binding cassette transporter
VAGSGRIIRPQTGEIAFLPQRPYTPPGSLRQILIDGQSNPPADERIVEVLHSVGLAALLPADGDLDRDEELAALISSHDQQLLALARILLAAPRFVFLDRIGALLGPERTPLVLDLLSLQSITILHDGEPDEPRDRYQAILHCEADGSWTWLETDA